MTEGEMMREAREGKPQTADKKENERVTRMGSGNIPALVVEFAVPAILGMLVNGAYNIIDSVFLGHGAGEIGLSAVSVATPIMTVFMAISMLIGAGGNALCALRLGEGKHSEAEHVLGNTFTLGVLVSILLAVLAHVPVCIEPLLSLSSATDTVRPMPATSFKSSAWAASSKSSVWASIISSVPAARLTGRFLPCSSAR